MALPLPLRRLHLFEIDDQPWFPPSLRLYVQAVLTHLWDFRLPPLQSHTPSSLVALVLQKTLGHHIRNYTFVDFCSGAGGPTPSIEWFVNRALQDGEGTGERRAAQLDGFATPDAVDGGNVGEDKEGEGGVPFVMTDIHPHLPAWRSAGARSRLLGYIPEPIDAADAPADMLSLVEGATRGAEYGNVVRREEQGFERGRPIFRLFSLAFHHFDDELAERILRNTLQTSDGFAIFELQGRDVGNLLTVLMLGPLLWLGSWYWFWGDWGHLFWTYVIPVVPFVIVYDGLVSCLRTRRDGEVLKLLQRAAEIVGGGIDGWRFEVGGEVHTWPSGTMQYFIGVKG